MLDGNGGGPRNEGEQQGGARAAWTCSAGVRHVYRICCKRATFRKETEIYYLSGYRPVRGRGEETSIHVGNMLNTPGIGRPPPRPPPPAAAAPPPPAHRRQQPPPAAPEWVCNGRVGFSLVKVGKVSHKESTSTAQIHVPLSSGRPGDGVRSPSLDKRTR